MKLIVTGAAGFIGSHVAKAALRGRHAVVGIDNLNDYYPVTLKRDRLADIAAAGAMEFVEADVSDLETMRAVFRAHRDATHVVHLAAQAGVRYSIVRPDLYVTANVMGQVGVFEAARMLERCEHVVYASTSSVYGANRDLPFSTGQRVETPVSLYAATKLAAEHIAASYAQIHGLPATGLRLFTVYGPWGRPDMAYWLFAEAILAGRPIAIHGHGEMSRDFTYVDDVVAGIMGALGKPPPPEGVRHKVYNIGNSRPTRLMTFIGLLETALGRTAEKHFVDAEPGEMVATCADITEAERDFGFRPVTPIEEGIRAFARWFASRDAVLRERGVLPGRP